MRHIVAAHPVFLVQLREGRDGRKWRRNPKQRQGKSRRVVCFVPDLFFALRLNLYPDTWKQLGTFPWDAIRPVTDVVVVSPDFHRATVFSDAAPTKQTPVRNAETVPAQRTLGCHPRR
ncbi:hypothetical protein ACFWVF_19310 [Streptomyces sp. NPDC058659]|uniref:hypothetical protein n=1 Tax=unclassified Streptomyces TaxID=2593676 RepID=UPI003653CA65